MAVIFWFRRDLRLKDNPALLAAIDSGEPVIPVFMIDPALWDRAGAPRQGYLVDALQQLDRSLHSHLVVLHGDPAAHLPEFAERMNASAIYASADFGNYGQRRDARVRDGLMGAGVRCELIGSPYAVAPGRVAKEDGTAYRVFTPFYRAWCRHGWRAPALPAPADGDWLADATSHSDGYPTVAIPDGMTIPTAGEEQAWQRWDDFRQHRLARYQELRNRPDVSGTSGLSVHLKWGEIHPRSLLAALGNDDGAETFRKELCWREFYADVLHQAPASSDASLDSRFDAMPWSENQEHFVAWQHGRTGYPFVDAGMRQLLAEGWMHNRVRMVVASFLVKDLHQRWQDGARHFMRLLVDGDSASNAHGWQWTAGCGTDASPFYRVFNPVLQAEKFDPSGDYVRKYIPELAHLPGKAAHQPWDHAQGYDRGYPSRIVDHSVERQVALDDYSVVKNT